MWFNRVQCRDKASTITKGNHQTVTNKKLN